MRRSFEQKALSPSNAWEGVVSRAYTASMLEAGRDPVKELQTRQAKANAEAAQPQPQRRHADGFYHNR